MANEQSKQEINFTVDTKNLYREENFTDLKVASIRVLTPVHKDGTRDKSRTSVYVGNTQLMSPEGPLPLQSVLPANNLQEAYDAFPEAMEKAMARMIEQVKKMQEAKQNKEESRIIVPGQ